MVIHVVTFVIHVAMSLMLISLNYKFQIFVSDLQKIHNKIICNLGETQM